MVRPTIHDVNAGLANATAKVSLGAMPVPLNDQPISRGDIIWLGVASGTTGGLLGGMVLGIGIAMMLSGLPIGLLLICIGAPASALVGWLLARRLSRRFPE